MNADFVIISYGCNFWGLAALEALVEAAGIDRDVHVVHNDKSTGQIDHFEACCRRADRPDAINPIIAYEGVFETRFRPEFFRLDEDTDVFECFFDRPRECGMARGFAARFLSGASGSRSAVESSPPGGGET